MNVLTRAQAIASGSKRYFTGKPCPHGHVAERLVSSMGCIACASRSFKAHYHANAEDLRARVKAYRSTEEFKARRREARRAAGDEYRAKRRKEYAASADRERDRAAAYRAANPEAVREASRRWAQKNRPIKTAAQREREARLLRATPAWADREAIKLIYIEAARLTIVEGVRYEVDHVYPLQGKSVCGLHVAENLRPVPAAFNRRKNNKMPEGVS
ncbi:MAG: hypothetical protein KA224_02575 [Steroidobacteraceae bacterium]|nr:hypothetical protein [Steroidobacteraceae bacterium]MBP8176162.1 hypothetical protein [Xanthomonadales bacterium]